MSLPDEELLSAYLDSELSADERSRVEQLLADSAETRQLLDELRSIRASLQRMPRVRLGHEFADQVLRQAEKELLTSTSTATAGIEMDQTEHVSPEPATLRAAEPAERAERLGGLSWQRARRPVIWASLALAAGLLFMFLDRERAAKLDRQVAMAPAAQEGDRNEREAWADGALGDSLDQPLGTPKSKTGGESDFSAAEAAPALPAAPAAESSPPPALVTSRAASPVAQPARPDPGKDVGRGLMEGEDGKKSAGMPADAVDDSRAGGDGPLVVWCDVAPGVDYRRSFREMLAQQNIRWEAQAEIAETEALLGRRVEKLAKKRPAANEPAGRDHYKQLEEQDKEARLADVGQAVLDSDAEVVLVEASQPQIEAVLAAIDGAAKVFVNVDVETPPDGPQQQRQLQRFARSKVSSEKASEQLDEATKQSAAKEPQKRDELQKREDPAKAEAKAGLGTASQSESATGTARRLTVRTGPLADETLKSDDEKEELSQLAVSRRSKESDTKLRQLPEKPLSFGLALPGQTATQDRFQVLFVLRPAEASGKAPDAKPAAKDD